MAMMEGNVLYLTGKLKDASTISDHKDDTVVLLPASSLIVVFVLNVGCSESLPVEVVIVTSDTEFPAAEEDESDKTGSVNNISEQIKNLYLSEKDEECLFPLSLTSLPFKVLVKNEGDCPPMIRNTKLPAVLHIKDKWCVVGMCSALRYILQKSAELYKNEVSKKLLGFRESCLHSCSEVSCWTKFCEIEMPEALEDIYKEKMLNEFPRTVLRYNCHMSRPPILHNALKRKQQYIRETVKNKEERQRLLSLRLHELPELDHEYAEGLDITLADVMLFACFELIVCRLSYMDFEKHSPLVLKWLDLIKNTNFVLPALKSFRLIKNNTVKSSLPSKVDIIIPEVKDESLYKSDPDRAKQFCTATMTSQNGISKAVSLLEEGGVDIQYTKQTDEQIRSLPWTEYPSAVHPQEGELPKKRLERKCQQLDNMVRMVISVAKDGDRIVDFCAGGGHVGIVLAYCLPKCTVLLVENKASSLLRAKSRVANLGLTNVEFYQCNLDYFKGTFDVGVCLHACGQATDLVLQKCFKQEASFVCSPCCYGSIQPNHSVTYPRSTVYNNLLNNLENYLCLGHGSDQTHGPDHPSTPQGQQCMRFIDGDRLKHAAQLGYKGDLFIMEPITCSPKNHILTGVLAR